MFNDIKLNRKTPVYIQIKDYIKNMILKGMIRKDEKLPSTRELSSLLSVSRNTIVCAYETLRDEGFIYMKIGKGAFVSDVQIKHQSMWKVDWTKMINSYAKNAEKFDTVKHEAKWKKGMISFKSIAPDENLFEVEEFKKAFLNRMSIEGEKILNYGYAKGYSPLIKYLLKYMENKGVNIKNKDILITNGFTEGFDIILSSILNDGDNIICENPTHDTAIKIMKLHNLNIHGVKLDNDGVNLDELKNTLSQNKFKIAYLIPSYHNPTGIVMSADKRIKVYNLLKEYNVPIIEDGFNEELRYMGSHIAPIMALSDNGNSVLYVGSLSKILFPGIRIGWIMADQEFIGYLESVKRSRNIHTSFLDQAVLYEYLESGNFEKYIRKARKVYKEKYEFVLKCADKYIPDAKVYGEGGLHIFIKLEGVNARNVLKICCERGVIFTPGDIFYTDHSRNDTFRLGFSRVSINEIERGFKIIGDVVKELKV